MINPSDDLASVIYLSSERIVSICEKVLPDVQAYNVPRASYPYGNYYATVRLGQLPAPITSGHGAQRWRFRVPYIIELHSGYLTEGTHDYEVERRLMWERIPTLYRGFVRYRNLVTSSVEDAPRWLDQSDGAMSLTCTGYIILRSDDQRQVTGARYTLTLAYDIITKTEFIA